MIFESNFQVNLMMFNIKKMKWTLQQIILSPFYVLLVLLISGCFVMGHDFKVGESLSDKDLEKIQPGRTTKQEVLEMFGPPLGIARRGKVLKVPSAIQGKMGWEEIQSETFFELFSTKHTLTNQHIIYYYFSTEASGIGGIFLFFGKESTDIHVDKLWFLINEQTAIVEDYIFRDQE